MNETVNLTVYQFGPISEADVVFDKYTVLIGKQGSGKSTIAKLYSMFTWLEKGLARRITSEKYITQYSIHPYHRLYSKNFVQLEHTLPSLPYKTPEVLWLRHETFHFHRRSYNVIHKNG